MNYVIMLLNFVFVSGTFYYLEDKIYQQFSRDVLDVNYLLKSYYYYDGQIFGDLTNINFDLGFWLKYQESANPQIILQTDYIVIAMSTGLITSYLGRTIQANYEVNVDQTNWLFFSFQQQDQIHTLYLHNAQQSYQVFQLDFLGYPSYLSFFETELSILDGWQGQAEQLRLITGVNFQSRDYYNYITFSTLQLKTLLLLEFEEKKQTKLLKDKSNFDYEVILGGSYDIMIDADDPILDLSDQSFKFESSKFLTIPNFYLPSTFTIQFKLGLSDLIIPQFTLLTLVQQEIDLLIVEYLVGGSLTIKLDSLSFMVPIDFTQNCLQIQIFFIEMFDELNGNSFWCKLYQIGSDGSLITSGDAKFPYINLNQKYSQTLLIGHQNNNIPQGSYFKLYEVKISQGAFYMENNYAANCMLFVDSRCEICSPPYLVDYDGTCVSQCSNNYVFNTFHNKCIKKCHTLCETCLDTDPTQCLFCAGDRANPPSCDCTSGFEDYVSPTCKQYLKDISVQVGIIEGTCKPPSNTFTQLFLKPYQTTPKVVLSLIGLIESLNQYKFVVFNSNIAGDSFDITAECDLDVYFRIQWISGISENFINSIQTNYGDNLNPFYYYYVPQVSSGNSQYDTFIGWEYAYRYSSSYISRYDDENIETEIFTNYDFLNLAYQTFEYANFQSITTYDQYNYNDERTENLFGTSGASSQWNFDIPESIDYFYFLWQLYGDNGVKFITKANITTSHQLEITKIKYGNDYFNPDEFTIFILATQCQTDICDYYQSMNHQFNPASLSSICQKGYFSDGQTCQPCDINCYECSDNVITCVSCLASQLKQLDSSTCICIDGYVLDEANLCQLCDSNCLTCQNSPTECTGCDSAQYLTLSFAGSSCQCIDRMEFDENQICVCSSGYYDSAGECLGCMSLCQDCNDGSTCISCVDNSTYQDLEQICQCNTGYYSSNNECLQCNSNCQKCETTSTNCISCNSNLIVVSGVCQCDTNQYLDDSNVCQLCDASCLTCQSSPNNCTTCDSNSTIQFQQNNMEIVIGYCVCHSEYYLPVNAACQSCDPNCVECQDESTKCTQCLGNDHQLLNEITNKCECEVGYYMVDNGCLKCDSLCHECVGEADFCTSCPSEFKQTAIEGQCQCLELQYVDSSNICQDCDSNCLTCETEPKNCLSCYPYFYLLNSECVECHKTCSSCSGPQETECTACITNMTKNEESLCVCKEGYFEEEPLKCSECKKTCKSCENGNECKECLTGLNRKLDNSNQCSCEKGFYEVNQEQECQSITNLSIKGCMKTCVTCNNGTSCTSCDPETRELLKGVCQCKDGYFQNGLGECISCESVEAQSVESCNYKNCSDKVWTKGEECDDGNNIARDGCTNCQIDPNYKCVNELLEPSFCYTCPESCNSCELEGDLIICQECQDGYFLYESQCKQCSGSCQTCESLTFCKTCQVQSFIPNEIGKCPVCEDTPGLYTQGSQCVPKCGDGILYEATEACDDGNTTSGDGCDSSCQKEKNFNCTGGVCEKVDPPKVEATYTNATTKNDILLSLPKNQKDPCANIIITIEAFNDTDFQSSFKFDNTSETQQCNIDFTFLKTIDESNLIHLFVPIVDDNDNSTNSTSRRLSEAETREVVITPRKQIYYSESQKAQAKTAQSAQDSFGYSLYIIGPAAIILGGFNFFWTIMDILSWLNNLYYFNIFFPDNVGVLFQQAAWGDFEIIPPIVEFNQESDPYYTESPLKFMEKGVDPVFLNNTWMCFSVISITLLAYVGSIILYYCITCYMQQQQSKTSKIKAISLFKINQLKPLQIQSSPNSIKKYELRGFLKKVFVKVKDYNINIAGYIIKSLNLGILDLILAITLQLIYFNFDQYQYLDILVNGTVGYISIVLVCIVLWFQYQMTNQHFLLLSDKRYEAKFGTLYEGINVKSKLAMSYSFFNLVRKALYIIFLIIFYENPIFQTLCCCLISFINVGLIIYENPFTSKAVLAQNGIPDFCIFSLTLISTGIALDDRIGYLDATQRFNIGWVMISFIGLSILTQMAFLMKEFCSDLYCKYLYFKEKFTQTKNKTQV